MLYFDFRKVGESISDLKKCQKTAERCFEEINNSIEELKKADIEYVEETIKKLSVKKDEMVDFLLLLRQIIGAAEFAYERYRMCTKRLTVSCEKLFLPSKALEKMQLISLKEYIAKMENIEFREGRDD